MKQTLRMMLLFLATSAVGNATTYYVATTGSDSNPGTQSQPFASIHHSMGVVNAGDTVIVEDGTYNETNEENASGTAGAPITFAAQNQWGAVIAPTAGGEILSVNGSYVVFKGFEIVGNSNGTNNDGIKFQGPGNGGQALNNKIHNIGTGNCTGGAPIISAQGNAVIDSNYLYDYGQAGCSLYEGIYLNDGNNQTVTNNIIGDASGSGSQLIGIQVNGQEARTATFPSNETIANNTIFNVTAAGIPLSCWNIPAAHNCSNNIVNNNILYNVNSGGNNHTIATGNNGGTFDNTNQYSNNVIFCCGTANMAGGQTLTATITSNPLFVNYTGSQTGNYQLQANSPAVGAGTMKGCPATDFNGNSRSGSCTIGAYASNAGGGPPPPPTPAAPTGLTATVN